jgi:hypothetical protein
MVKVSLMCRSLLLENSLKRFLKHQITDYNHCDVVLSDQQLNIDKPYLMIGSEHYADISKPFTHADILLELDKFTKSSNQSANSRPIPTSLDEKINKLTRTYQEQLHQLIKEHYEHQSI